jgi:hypothetical protein
MYFVRCVCMCVCVCVWGGGLIEYFFKFIVKFKTSFVHHFMIIMSAVKDNSCYNLSHSMVNTVVIFVSFCFESCIYLV